MVNLAVESGIKKTVIVGGFEAYKVTDMLKSIMLVFYYNVFNEMPENDDDDVNLPYKMAKMLVDKGILVGLENSGSMERMNTRNLPFLAGTCAAYGLDREQALH
jgi:hypothetical protein